MAADGTRLVARVGLGERSYALEAQVIARVREAGIGAPEVLGVVHVDGHPVSVARWMAGRSLAELDPPRRFDVDGPVTIPEKAGVRLREIHDVPTTGLDLPCPPTAASMRELAFATADRLPGSHSGTLRDTADHLGVLDDATEAVLCHGDFGPDHLFVAEGLDDGLDIVGVIDWELANISDPARDLAWWLCYFEPRLPGSFELLCRGYGADGDVTARARIWALAECVFGADFRLSHDDLEGALDSARRAGQLLAAD
jgi:aminoglycoside phosphotransferase (APT) family kinase protein